MKHKYLAEVSLQLIAALLAIIVFTLDTVTRLEVAAAAFYTIIILLSVRFCNRRGTIIIAAGCVGLTLLSQMLTPADARSEAGLINTAISILVIISTTYLIVRIEYAERAANEARDQLIHAARIAALGELTASIAHEVNQPVAAAGINANSAIRWLEADPPQIENAKTALTRAVAAIARAGDVFHRIRNLARRGLSERIPCNVGEIIRDVLGLIGEEIRKNGIRLKISIDDDTPPIFADRIQIEQVILNLALNAIEELSNQPASRRSLSVAATRDMSGNALVIVTDSGAGFAPDQAEQLFQPFVTTKPKGLGLGLAVARSIIDSHGGRIWAEKVTPEGTIFQFALPAAVSQG